jgi:5-methyltetrahydropteroyltriglutamate--homocysteine methyltransferase
MGQIYRADVLGSLLRPTSLKEARNAFEAGRISVAELKRIEDRCVDAMIAMQEAVDLDVISDGEMRRSWFSGLFTDQLEGIGHVPALRARLTGEGTETPKEYDVPVVTGKISRRRPWATEEFAYARARARKPLKATLPSPLMIYLHWTREHSSGAYPDPFKLFADTTEIVRAEVQELAAIGCTYIQIDAPEICLLLDPAFRK